MVIATQVATNASPATKTTTAIPGSIRLVAIENKPLPVIAAVVLALLLLLGAGAVGAVVMATPNLQPSSSGEATMTVQSLFVLSDTPCAEITAPVDTDSSRRSISCIAERRLEPAISARKVTVVGYSRKHLKPALVMSCD